LRVAMIGSVASALRATTRSPDRLTGFMVASGLALAAFCAVGSITWPFGRDQGIFAWVADVVLKGGTLYRDAWEVKGPMTYYFYAFSAAAFGNDASGIRAFDLILVVLGTLLLWRLVTSLSGGSRFAAAVATAFFTLGYYGCGFWSTAQPDEW